jgi:hypothetical protein
VTTPKNIKKIKKWLAPESFSALYSLWFLAASTNVTASSVFDVYFPDGVLSHEI